MRGSRQDGVTIHRTAPRRLQPAHLPCPPLRTPQYNPPGCAAQLQSDPRRWNPCQSCRQHGVPPWPRASTADSWRHLKGARVCARERCRMSGIRSPVQPRPAAHARSAQPSNHHSSHWPSRSCAPGSPIRQMWISPRSFMPSGNERVTPPTIWSSRAWRFEGCQGLRGHGTQSGTVIW